MVVEEVETEAVEAEHITEAKVMAVEAATRSFLTCVAATELSTLPLTPPKSQPYYKVCDRPADRSLLCSTSQSKSKRNPSSTAVANEQAHTDSESGKFCVSAWCTLLVAGNSHFTLGLGGSQSSESN